MPSDCYKVEVLHYMNPHLIWIEILDPSVQKKENVIFEQIGVDGVLPQEKTISLSDHLNLEIEFLMCEEWIPAASAVMKYFLQRSEEIWFSPTHIDKGPSIFDKNTHKFGEIIIKSKNGKLKRLSELLVKSGFAYYNQCEFYKKLSCGKLKTKLSISQTQHIIKELENYYTIKGKMTDKLKKSIEKQTSVFKMVQNFELSISESNIEKQFNNIINTVLKNKYKDFELCKDVDEKSLGRACHKMKRCYFSY